MYKKNQLWNRYFLRSQSISYRYRETPRCPSIYIIDLNQFLLLFLLTITKQKYFSSSTKLLFNYIVYESILLLVVRPRYSENYIATISCTWEWASRDRVGESKKIKTQKIREREREREREIRNVAAAKIYIRKWIVKHIYIYIYILFHLGDIKRVNEDSRDGSGASGKESPLSKP